MKIKLKREGGFMGMPSGKDLELDQLSDEEKAAFEEAIENTQTKHESTIQDRSMPSADAFCYIVKMKKGAKNITMKFNDTNIPDSLYTIFQKYLT
jgi:hypothetical protein